jgi:hypothetical protein
MRTGLLFGLSGVTMEGRISSDQFFATVDSNKVDGGTQPTGAMVSRKDAWKSLVNWQIEKKSKCV